MSKRGIVSDETLVWHMQADLGFGRERGFRGLCPVVFNSFRVLISVQFLSCMLKRPSECLLRRMCEADLGLKNGGFGR